MAAECFLCVAAEAAAVGEGKDERLDAGRLKPVSTTTRRQAQVQISVPHVHRRRTFPSTPWGTTRAAWAVPAAIQKLVALRS